MTIQSRSAGTVVVGGGQAGLAAGYHLARRGEDFVIVDAGSTVGESWRERWDSLRLFTPAGFTALPGQPFPAPSGTHPSKDDVADYMARYAERFDLPIELGTRVEGAHREGNGLVVRAGSSRWQAHNIVIASGAHSSPIIPSLANSLDSGIEQWHAQDYRRPGQVPGGTVLIVGAGNSGAEIALDLATDTVEREVLLAGRDVGHIPRLGPWTFQVMHRFGGIGAALAQRGLQGRGDPLGRLTAGQLETAGVQRRPRLVGTRQGAPMFSDGRTATVTAVVWCTGARPDHSWLHLDAFDSEGRLRHRHGVVEDEPGLYAVGLPYQRSATSHLVGGVGTDARYVVEHLVSRRRRMPSRTFRRR
ncbi:flavin-containing monooxygenase [Ruania alba]|uniref:Putative flavoprotein involved in K+ transport n=1 Tax=Ruania alba TaxID=648782 RepID=A0A1H5KUD5_9MICO|nr:NAD(P)-binding domain-containing protein [Ruania alba]SEE68456.1 putative flavoprotein involved in K+ transport [Ruania alba]